MKNTKIEFRSAIKLNEDSRTISGYALIFEKWSKYMGFYEILKRGCIDENVLNHSDIILNYNHDDTQILARSQYGEGTLKLKIDDEGLYFECNVPDTQLGNDLYYHISNGNLNECSFCFSLAQEDDAERWYENEDGELCREILKIGALYDCAICPHGAYADTSVNARYIPDEIQQKIDNMENTKRNMTQEEEAEKQANLDEIETLKAQVIELQNALIAIKTQAPAEPADEDKEKEKEEETKSDPADETNENGEETTLEDNESAGNNENDETHTAEESVEGEDKNTSKRYMKKTLIGEIRNAIENNTKQFTINAETRAYDGKATVAGFDTVTGDKTTHHDTTIVEDEVQGILEPLYAESVLAKLGVRMYTGLPQGDITVPVMGKGTVGWKGEVAAADPTKNEFNTVTLQPKRLTAYVDISKKLIAQDTVGVEAAIRRDIVNALSDKLEATILSADAKTDDKPAGLFNGKTLVSCTSYKNLCDLEAGIEENNFNGETKYLLSPKAKAFLRQLAKSTKVTQLVWENGEVDGTQALVTSNVPANDFIYGNFNDVIVGSWGNIDITVDEYTQAINGCIRLVINAYFDCKIARTDALAFGKVVA